MTKNFDASLRLGSKFGPVAKTRFSPYRGCKKGPSKDRRSLDDESKTDLKKSRRRYKSEPSEDVKNVLDPNPESEIDKIYSTIKPPEFPTKIPRVRSITVSESGGLKVKKQRPEVTPSPPLTCHEEVNVNELAAYLENSVLIPRKMSSMAETIYG